MQSIARKKGHDKKVLLLRLEGREFLVCDEYYPTDAGRVHVLNGAYYATFDLATFVVEYQKAAFDVVSIIYSGDSWPTAIADPRDYKSILAHFGLPPT